MINFRKTRSGNKITFHELFQTDIAQKTDSFQIKIKPMQIAWALYYFYQIDELQFFCSFY